MFTAQIIRIQLTRMTQIKIEPWDQDKDQNITYVKKLHTLSNFSSSNNLKKIHIKNKKEIRSDQIVEHFHKKDKILSTESAQTTLQNFSKTNRSQYHHRVTKLVFTNSSSKKYKFEPQSLPSRKRLGLMSLLKLQQSSPERHKKVRQPSQKSIKKQIYYNLTEVNSSLNSTIKLKCFTQTTDDKPDPKIKLLEKLRIEKKTEICPLRRQLSVQRKIFVLQSGNKIANQLLGDKKKKRRTKNMIEEICRAEREYSRERRKV